MSQLQDAPTRRWDEFRSQMPVTRRWAYFDHAAVAPLSGPAQTAVAAWTEQAATEGDTVWGQWSRRIEEARHLAASLIAADPSEIALVPNTTAGIGLVAEGYPWQHGENVVILANEFPSNQYPWMNLRGRGVETRRVTVDGVAVDLNRLADACDAGTRVVSVSWVGYASGWRTDVAQLAEVVHQQGALLFLDAIQGLGVFPMNVDRTGVDFLAADGHKWLLGPEGAGLLYVRREHLDRLRPLGVGWNSVVGAHDFTRIDLDIRPEASRYEGGSQNMVGFIALEASLRLLERMGLSPDASPLADRVLEITDRACDRLRGIGAEVVSSRQGERRSGIVLFRLPGRESESLCQRCVRAGVAVSCRAGCLRISPHAYVNDEDIDRLLSALSD